jgi:1-acyl-sn-glycerol-3-phosphate acyltransferase
MPDPDPTFTPVRQAWSNPIRAGFRLLLILIVSYSILFIYLLWRLIHRDTRKRLQFAVDTQAVWARCCMKILSWKMLVSGSRPEPGSLLTPNHVTYGDILVLSAAAGTFFVPKGEIADWPLIGGMVRAMEHPFVSRARSKSLRKTIAHVGEKLKGGQSVAVFLEGTTTQGNWVRPFLPSMLQPAIETAVPIVPVSLVWKTTREGMTVEDDVAYWTDIAIIKHVWRILGLKGIQVEVRFGEPILPPTGLRPGEAGSTEQNTSVRNGSTRKELAVQLHAKVVRLGDFKEDIPGSYQSLEETRKLFSGP